MYVPALVPGDAVLVHSDRLGLTSGEVVRQCAVVIFGLGLLVLTLRMDEQWLVAHFPPDYFPPYSWIENGVLAARSILAMAGIGLIFAFRRQSASMLKRAAGGTGTLFAAAIIVATLLALALADFILGSPGWQSVNAGDMQREPLRRHDPVLGWTLQPSHTGYLLTGGRWIEYASDAFGYREPSQDVKPDFARPTILLAGESMMDGFGLNWDETIPAEVGRLTNTQAVDLSVGGYATDQIYLRLKSELPRFERPVAVVILFSPMLFRRNIDDFRPHLGPDLALRPPVRQSRLMDIARWAIPYRSAAETDRAVLTTRTILSAAVRLARSRGAVPIILVPQFVPENSAERLIRSRVLGNIDLPVVSVPLDSRWRLAGDWHPDARAARVMALAIFNRLQASTQTKHNTLAKRSIGGRCCLESAMG
jgi:hypothetical protein